MDHTCNALKEDLQVKKLNVHKHLTKVKIVKNLLFITSKLIFPKLSGLSFMVLFRFHLLKVESWPCDLGVSDMPEALELAEAAVLGKTWPTVQ
jgi:hypothetical protein